MNVSGVIYKKKKKNDLNKLIYMSLNEDAKGNEDIQAKYMYFLFSWTHRGSSQASHRHPDVIQEVSSVSVSDFSFQAVKNIWLCLLGALQSN